MNTFFSRLTSGRRGSCPPAFLPSRGRRPAREIATRELRSEWSISKPGQALPPPPGLAGGLSASPARPCRTRAGLMRYQRTNPPPGLAGGLSASPARRCLRPQDRADG